MAVHPHAMPLVESCHVSPWLDDRPYSPPNKTVQGYLHAMTLVKREQEAWSGKGDVMARDGGASVPRPPLTSERKKMVQVGTLTQSESNVGRLATTHIDTRVTIRRSLRDMRSTMHRLATTVYITQVPSKQGGETSDTFQASLNTLVFRTRNDVLAFTRKLEPLCTAYNLHAMFRKL